MEQTHAITADNFPQMSTLAKPYEIHDYNLIVELAMSNE